jgi:hypothetical protein
MLKNILGAAILTIILTMVAGVCATSANSQAQNIRQIQSEEAERAQIQNQESEQETSEVKSQNQLQPEKQQKTLFDAQEHRSVVANAVQSLLEVADRQGGIGEQVRVIARQQNQSASTTIKAMEKVQERSKMKTFFFGVDYRNLGALRNETVKTSNTLEQLNRLAENIQNEGDRTELQNQIQVLEQEKINIENFTKEQEEKFSLLGWVVKLLGSGK